MRRRRYWTPAEDAALAKFVAERKWTVDDLAYLMDRQPPVIRKRCKHLGLTLRTSAEARAGCRFSLEARARMSAAAKRRWAEGKSTATILANLRSPAWHAYNATRWRAPDPATPEGRLYRKFREHMGAAKAKTMLGIST